VNGLVGVGVSSGDWRVTAEGYNLPAGVQDLVNGDVLICYRGG